LISRPQPNVWWRDGSRCLWHTPSTAEMSQEPWPAEIAGPKFASFLESTLDQLLCKHRELLVTQFREVLKDDKLGPSAPTSRPPALKPALDPGLAERLKGSESFLAKVKTKAGLDKPRACATLGMVEAAVLDQLTDDVTPAGKRTFSSPQILRTVQADPPMPLGPPEEPCDISMGYTGQQIMPAPHESQGSLSSQPAPPSRSCGRRVTDRGSNLRSMDRDSNAWILESGIHMSQRAMVQDPACQLTSIVPSAVIHALRFLLLVLLSILTVVKALGLVHPATSFLTIVCCVVYGTIGLYCFGQVSRAVQGPNLQLSLAKLYVFVDDFRGSWQRASRQERRFFFAAWAFFSCLSFAAAQGMESWLQELRSPNLDVQLNFVGPLLHVSHGLFVVAFGATSALVFMFAFVHAHILMGLDSSLDCWCCDLVNDPNFHAGIQSWNLLQALLKAIGRELAFSLAVAQGMGYFGLVLFLVKLFDVLLRSELETYPIVAEALASIPLLVLLALNLRVCSHAAALTEKCGVIPAFVSQIPSGIVADKARQYLVRYVSDSSAGFFVGSVRLTQEVFFKQMYLLATLLSGLAGVVARTYL